MSTHFKGTESEITALNAFIAFFRSFNTFNSRIVQEIKTYGITEPQFGILEILLHLGPQQQHNLAEKLLVSGGNITFIVDKLEKTGLVKRTVQENDRRCKLVSLTEKGRLLIKSLFPGHVRFIENLMGVLTPDEQIEFTRICKIIGKKNQKRQANEI